MKKKVINLLFAETNLDVSFLLKTSYNIVNFVDDKGGLT